MSPNRSVLMAAIAGLALQSYAAFALADDDDVKVVASGLLSPRGLDFAPNGQLYVVEAGIQTTDASAPCITGGMGTQCYTDTGALTRVDPWGIHAAQKVASHLPTLADVGPNDVSFFGMDAYVLIGLGSDPANRATLTSVGASKANLLGTVIRVNPWNGRYGEVADISAVESTLPNGPDGAYGGCCVDSDPFGILAEPGRLIVADAGGNDLIEVKANGQKKVLAVFPARPGAGGNLAEAVPTRVTKGPDGYLYVSELFFGEYFGPTPGGSARIYRIPPGGCQPINKCSDYIDGFSTIMDIDFDRQGNLYVLEYIESGFGSPGAIIKIDRNGNMIDHDGKVCDDKPCFFYDKLSSPGGFALSDDAIYVSNNGTSFGGTDGLYGEVLRIPLDNDHHRHHGEN